MNRPHRSPPFFYRHCLTAALVLGLLPLITPATLAGEARFGPQRSDVEQAAKEAQKADEFTKDPKYQPADPKVKDAEDKLDKANQKADDSQSKYDDAKKQADKSPTDANKKARDDAKEARDKDQQGVKDSQKEAKQALKDSKNPHNGTTYRDKLAKKREARDRLAKMIKALKDAVARAKGDGKTVKPEEQQKVDGVIREGEQDLKNLGAIALGGSGSASSPKSEFLRPPVQTLPTPSAVHVPPASTSTGGSTSGSTPHSPPPCQ